MTDHRIPTILVIGVGNEFRSDDAVGLAAARALRSDEFEDVIVIETPGDNPALIESWEGFDRVIIVDAVCSGSPAGTIHRVNGRSLSLELERFRSSHSYGVADAVRLAQKLGRMPKYLVLFGLEGAEFGFGQNLSSQVEASLPVLVERIRDELACVGGETGVS